MNGGLILPWELICDKAVGVRTVNWGWRDGAAAEEYVLLLQRA